MPNPNPYKARHQRAENRARALEPVLEAVLEAVEKARELLHSEDPQVVLRAVHAVSQAGASASKVFESTVLAERVEALEASASTTNLN